MALLLDPSKSVEQHDGLSQAILQASELPADALVACFQLLDWRSLCVCSCTCRTWRRLANAPGLWQQQLALQYHRPPLLQYCSHLSPTLHGLPVFVAGEAADAGQCAARDLASFTTSDTVAAAVGGGTPPATGHATAAPTRAAVAASASASSVEHNPKQLFAQFMAHPASAHQALLARFHTAMKQISSWRLIIKQTQTLAARQATAAAVAAEEAGGQALFNSLDRSYQGTQQQQQLAGHPAPLRWADLQSGVCWCIGAVQQQHQEQSCWLRFNLPAELQQDQQLVAAAAAKQLTATVQALGPSNIGWFDVITSSPFQILDDDMEILMQSHKTGFYAWKQAPEDWPDQTADADPVPWDPRDNLITDSSAAAADILLGSSAAAAAAASIAQGLHQAVTQCVYTADQGVAEQQQQQPCKLRMLVYVHYEQLLQMLPCQLAQSLSPVSRSTLQQQQHQQQQRSAAQALGLQVAADKDIVLWLHIDVCQLHGSVRLGCCTAALRAAGRGNSCGHVEFTGQQEHVLAVLYNPACSVNCSTGDSSSRGAAAGCAGSTSAAGQQSPSRSSSTSGIQCSPLATRSTTAAAEETNMLHLVMLGQQQLQCSSTTASSTSDEGLVLASAADVLNYLLSKDEVMVDLALFDGVGRLLMGRAGVEVWSKEQTTFLTPKGAMDSQTFADNFDGPLDGPLVVHTRTVHMLHFLVDGVESRLWDNGITVDSVAAPDGPSGCTSQLPLIGMKLTWPALRGLIAGHAQPQQQQEGGVRGPEYSKSVGAVTSPALHETEPSSEIVRMRFR